MDATTVFITALVGAFGAIATALVTWAIATRTKSGRVATTDADRLWEQNGKLITALTQDNAGLRSRVDSLTSENETLRVRMHALEIKQQQTELAESECNERADRLAKKVAVLERALNIDSATERVVVEGEHLEAKGPEPTQ